MAGGKTGQLRGRRPTTAGGAKRCVKRESAGGRSRVIVAVILLRWRKGEVHDGFKQVQVVEGTNVSDSVLVVGARAG